MHYIVKVFFRDLQKFETVCITHSKDFALDAAKHFSSLNSSQIVEVYRESLVERVKCEL